MNLTTKKLLPFLVGAVIAITCYFCYLSQYGAAGLILLYSLPILLLNIKKIDIWAKKHQNLIVIFYLFTTSSLLSLIGSIYPAKITSETKGFVAKIPPLLEAIDDSATIYTALLLAVIISAYLFDMILKKMNAFVYYRGGLIDPVTTKENICIRIDTFTKLLGGKSIADSREIGSAIGADFCQNLTSIYKNIPFKEFVLKWSETDEKTGFFANITPVETAQSITLQIHNSFASKVLHEDNENICAFFGGYVTGILHTFHSDSFVFRATSHCQTCRTQKDKYSFCEFTFDRAQCDLSPEN